MKRLMIFGIILAFFAACNNGDDTGNEPVELTFDFSGGAAGWTGDFADYPIGEAESYELDYEISTLPAPLDENEAAFVLTGTNMSDDLFMFMKKKITGLSPNAIYNADFTVEFATNVPDGTVGIGGSPGESVFIKAGATHVEPVPVEDDMDYYRMNIDKGGQSQGGSDMVVVGDFSNDTDQEIYVLKTVSNETPFTVTTNQNGELWLIVGSDSGFEGNTTIYYNVVGVNLY